MDTQLGDTGSVSVRGGVNTVLGWEFGVNGTMRVHSGGAWEDTGVPFERYRWYHLRFEWDTATDTWRATVDGVKYPNDGSYHLSGDPTGSVVVGNSVAGGFLYADRFRIYPGSAQPTEMLTYDNTTFAVLERTDQNGVTRYFERDGLGRSTRQRNRRGRVIGSRTYQFSRTIGANGDDYDAANPNSVTDTRYPDLNGFQNLKQGEIVILSNTSPVQGTVDENGTQLSTGPEYSIGSGAQVSFEARDLILLKPGFFAQAGSEFRAFLKEDVPGGSTGDVSFGAIIADEIAVRMGPESTLDLGRPVAGRIGVRADVLTTALTNGDVEVLRIAGSDASVSIKYDSQYNQFQASFQLPGQSPVNQVYTDFVPTDYTWYTCEFDVDSHGNGSVTIRSNDPNDLGLAYSMIPGLPPDWLPAVTSSGGGGESYLSNVYVGPIERERLSRDGLGRTIQHLRTTDEGVLVKMTEYGPGGRPVRESGPASFPDVFTEHYLGSIPAIQLSRMEYMADPLVRIRSEMPPGYLPGEETRIRYGNSGGSLPVHRYLSRIDPTGVITTDYIDRFGRRFATLRDSPE